MPYVYVDELQDGMEEADVRSADEYSALQMELDTVIGQRDEFQRSIDELTGERDGLAAELDDAKRKFADSFLSSPGRAKSTQRSEMRSEEAAPKTFDSLFKGRNPENAN